MPRLPPVTIATGREDESVVMGNHFSTTGPDTRVWLWFTRPVSSGLLWLHGLGEPDVGSGFTDAQVQTIRGQPVGLWGKGMPAIVHV